MKLLLTCLLCLFCSCLSAQEAETSDTSIILASYVANWSNTRIEHSDCSDSSGDHAILGHCPSTQSIDFFYLASALTHIGIKSMLPSNVSKYFAGSNINVNAHIDPNYQSNISVTMSF